MGRLSTRALAVVHAAVVVAVTLALLAIGWPSLRGAAPEDPFIEQRSGAPALLALRIGLLVALAFVERRDLLRSRWFWATGALFVLSLAGAWGVIPFAAVAALGITRPPPAGADAPVAAARSAVPLIAVAALVAGIVLGRPSPGAAPSPAAPAAATVFWLERGNLFRAQYAAQQWSASHRSDPGRAQLVLAQIEWALGHERRARALAADVTARAPDPAMRDEAARLGAQWP